MPVYGWGSNHPLTDPGFYADDVIYFSDNGLYTVRATLHALGERRHWRTGEAHLRLSTALCTLALAAGRYRSDLLH